MEIKNIYKEKINSDIESDHIVLRDSNKHELECFWFSHEVIVSPRDNQEFVFLKTENPSLYKILSKFAGRIVKANDMVGGSFIDGNTFTWHHMARSWDRPFSENAGYIATMDKDSVRIRFFPAQKKSFGDRYISMGGPDGYTEPYQSISNLFAETLNDMLGHVQYNMEHDDDVM